MRTRGAQGRRYHRRVRAGRLTRVLLGVLAVAALVGSVIADVGVVPRGIPVRPGRADRTGTGAARSHATARGVLGAATLPSLPVPLTGLAVTAWHGALWAAGGLVNGTTSTTAIWRLTWPGGRRWVRVGSLPVARHDGALCAAGHGLLFVGGGVGSVSSAAVWWIRPAVRGVSVEVRAAPSLPVPRSDLSCVAGPTGAVYVVGGYDGSVWQRPVLRLSPGEVMWQAVGDLPVPVRYGGAARIGQSLVVAGGLTVAGPTAAVWLVPLRPGGAARRIGTLDVARSYMTAAASDGAVYAAGGEDAQGSLLKGVWRIAPGRHGSWRITRAFALPSPRAYGGWAAVPGGFVYVGGLTERGATKGVVWLRLSGL